MLTNVFYFNINIIYARQDKTKNKTCTLHIICVEQSIVQFPQVYARTYYFRECCILQYATASCPVINVTVACHVGLSVITHAKWASSYTKKL